MPQNRTKYQYFQEASLSQKLAYKDQEEKKLATYSRLAGSNPELSKSIGILLVFCEQDLLNIDDPSVQLMLALLDVQRKAEFATSSNTNEITKMGLQMPKSEDIITDFNEE